MGNILDFNDLFKKIIWKMKYHKILTFFGLFWVDFLKKYAIFLRFGQYGLCHLIWDPLNFRGWNFACSIPSMFSKKYMRRFWKFSFFAARLLSFAPFWPFWLILSINWAAAPRKMKIFKIAAYTFCRTLMGCHMQIFSIRSWVDLKWSEETRFCQNVKKIVFF